MGMIFAEGKAGNQQRDASPLFLFPLKILCDSAPLRESLPFFSLPFPSAEIIPISGHTPRLAPSGRCLLHYAPYAVRLEAC